MAPSSLPGGRPGDRPGAWTAADAAIVYALAVATFLAVPILAGGGLAGFAIAQALGLAALPIVAVRVRGLPLATLGVVHPGGRALAGAVLVGASLWYAAAAATGPWAELVGDRGGDEAVREIKALLAGAPALAIVTLTVVPAVCEELATRGVLVLGLRGRLGAPLAVLIGAAAFAVLHQSLVRALPTLLLGIAVGILAVRSGSVVPAIIAHGLNNAAALVLGAGLGGPVARAIDAAPGAALAASLALTAAGLGIAWAPPRRL